MLDFKHYIVTTPVYNEILCLSMNLWKNCKNFMKKNLFFSNRHLIIDLTRNSKGKKRWNMFFLNETTIGKISASNHSIQIALEQIVAEFYPKIRLITSKDSVAASLSQKNNPIRIKPTSKEQKELEVEIFVIFSFGSSIKNNGEKVIKAIKTGIIDQFGIEVNLVTVRVLGMCSRWIKPVNITIKG